MKFLKKALAVLALGTAVGCAGAHAAERASNAQKSADYTLAIEGCVQQAYKLIDAGAPKFEVETTYEECAKEVDKKYGKH